MRVGEASEERLVGEPARGKLVVRRQHFQRLAVEEEPRRVRKGRANDVQEQ